MVKTPKKKNKTSAAKKATDVFPKVQAIIARQLKKPPETITLESKLQADLNADSLDAMEIIFNIEEEFNIQVAEDAARKIVLVRDIVTYVAKAPELPKRK